MDLGGYSVAMPVEASETLFSATTLLWIVVSSDGRYPPFGIHQSAPLAVDRIAARLRRSETGMDVKRFPAVLMNHQKTEFRPKSVRNNTDE